MDVNDSPRYNEWSDPAGLRQYPREYVRKLIAERHYIRAKLENPGGSVILTASALVDAERMDEYSSSIGSSFHLDIMELDIQIKDDILKRRITRQEVEALLVWFDGLSSLEASKFLSARPSTIRKRQERALNKVTTGMNGEEENTATTRGSGDVYPSEMDATARDNVLQREHD